MIKLSHGLALLLAPILAALGKIPVELAMAIHKASKRSLLKTKYPTDLRKVQLILEVHHDVTGRLLEVAVGNGDIAAAVEKLRKLFLEEDYACNTFCLV